MCDKPTALPSSPIRTAREQIRGWAVGRYIHGPTEPYCADLDGGIGPAPGPNGSVRNYQRVSRELGIKLERKLSGVCNGKIKIRKIDGNPAFCNDPCLRHGMGGGNGDPRLLSRANGHAANLNWHNNLLVTTHRFPPPWSLARCDAWPSGVGINPSANFPSNKTCSKGQPRGGSFWLGLFAHVVGQM